MAGIMEWVMCAILLIVGIAVIFKLFDFIAAFIEFTGAIVFITLVGLFIGFCLLVYWLHTILF